MRKQQGRHGSGHGHLRQQSAAILKANAADLDAAKAGGLAASFIDRLTLTDASIEAMARGLFVAGGGAVDEELWPFDPLVHAWWVEPGKVLAGDASGNGMFTGVPETLTVARLILKGPRAGGGALRLTWAGWR